MWKITLPTDNKIFMTTENSSYLRLGILQRISLKFTHFLGRAVLSKTVNCSGVNLVDAVLSDLAITLDRILNIGMDFEQ